MPSLMLLTFQQTAEHLQTLRDLAYAHISHSSLLKFARQRNCLKLHNAEKQNAF